MGDILPILASQGPNVAPEVGDDGSEDCSMDPSTPPEDFRAVTVARRGSTSPPESGRARREGKSTWIVKLDRAIEGLSPGEELVFGFTEDVGLQVVCLLEAVDGLRLQARQRYRRRINRRTYLRVKADLVLRLRLLGPLEAADAQRWLAGADPFGDGWEDPVALVNMSVGGLLLETDMWLIAGERVLVELEVGPGKGPWRCLAVVVDVHGQAPQEPGAPHRVAVQFEQLPAGAGAALSALTFRRLLEEEA